MRWSPNRKGTMVGVLAGLILLGLMVAFHRTMRSDQGMPKTRQPLVLRSEGLLRSEPTAVAAGFQRNTNVAAPAAAFPAPDSSLQATAKQAATIVGQKDVPADVHWNLADPESRARRVERLAEKAAKAKEDAWAQARQQGWPRGTGTNEGNTELMGIAEGRVNVYVTHNANAAITTAADKIRQTPPYSLSGAGLAIGIWDQYAVRTTHQEFAVARVTVKDGAGTGSHATLVAGTIGATGITAAAKGMAPRVNIDSYEWTLDIAEMTARGMAEPGETNTLQISNHSYGMAAGWQGSSWYGTWMEGGTNRESDLFGQYDAYDSLYDTLCFNAPYYLPFVSAGNDRNDTTVSPFSYYRANQGWVSKTYDAATDPYGDGWDNGGYDTVPSFAVSKNMMIVGAVSAAVSDGARSVASASMSTFSGWGPADDGRIKPDIVADGVNIYTTDSDSDSHYSGSHNGTSYSAPNAAGSAILLTEYYGKLFTNQYMRASTLKGLILHTADDLGSAGPDYKFGWGLMNVLAAANMIRDYHDLPGAGAIREASLTTAASRHEFPLAWNGVNPIRVTLCWTDPPATAVSGLDNRSSRLINDLDLKIVTPAGATNFPYVLNVNSPSAVATNGDNRVDNVEQVYILTPPTSGVYTIIVEADGSLYDDQQAYSLIVSGSTLAPTIGHTPLQNTTNTVAAYTVDAEITPGVLLNTNRLAVLWNTDGSTEAFTTNTLTWVTNDTYRAEIPAQPLGTAASYWLRAVTTNGLATTDPTNAPAAMHRFEISEPVELTVSGLPGEYGGVSPVYGTHSYASGIVVEASASLFTNLSDDVRYACTGWVGSGSAPTEGASNTVAFPMTGVSTLTWAWATQVTLAQTSSVPGLLATSTWWAVGATAQTVTASSPIAMEGTNYLLAEWRVDGQRQPNETNRAVNPASILMETSHVAVAVYLPETEDVDEDGLPDAWERFYFGSTNSGAGAHSDADGILDGDEFADRTDPTDTNSFPTPPTIEHTPLANPQSNPAPYSVTATVTDHYTVAAVTLCWSRVSGSFLSTNMTAGSSNLYTATIPAPGTNGDSFAYYILAWDPAGHETSNGLYSFEVKYPALRLSGTNFGDPILSPSSTTNYIMTFSNAGLTELTWRLDVLGVGMSNDVESGVAGWTHGGTNDFWCVSVNRYHSAFQSWYCGDTVGHSYENGSHCWLTSPPFVAGVGARLSFWYWIATELKTVSPPRAYDGGVVELSTNGGSAFQSIAPVGNYPYWTVGNTSSPFPSNTACFAGTGGWQKATFDLSAFAGKETCLRYRFGSDAASAAEGWYLDDLLVTYLTDTNAWLASDPTNGVVAIGGASNVLVTLNSTNMATGDRGAFLRVIGNDPESPTNLIPVSMRVRSPPELSLSFALQTSTNGAGYVTVSNVLYDVDGETNEIQLEFSTNSGALWTNAWIRSATHSEGSPLNISNAALRQIVRIPTVGTNHVTALWDTTNRPPPLPLATDVLMRARAWDGLYWSASATSGAFMVDNEPPSVTPDLTVTNHTVSTWTTNRAIGGEWGSANDGLGGGLGGYGYAFTHRTGIAPPSMLTTQQQAVSGLLADGTNWWLSVRAVDRYGNAGTATNTGPYWIDATPPSATGAVVHIAHSAYGNYLLGTALSNSWAGFTDNLSGIGNYYASLSDHGSTTDGVWTTETNLVLSGATPDQTNRVYVWAQDVAGGIGPATSAWILVLTPTNDFDQDRISNAGEELAGTDAGSASSVFEFGPVTTTEPGETIVVQWNSLTNRVYSLYHRAALTNGTDWEAFAGFTNMPGAAGAMAYTDTVSEVEIRFYRVTVSLP